MDKPKLKAKLASQLLNQGVPTLLASQGVAFLTYWVFRDQPTATLADFWILLFSLTNSARIAYLWIDQRRFMPEIADDITVRYRIGALAGGVSWGSLILLYDPTLPLFVQLYFLVVLVGMPVASLASNAILFSVYLSFGLPILTALVLWALLLSPEFGAQFTLMGLVYTSLVLLIAKKYSENLITSLERSEENRELVREIKAANAKLLQLAYEDPLTNLSNRRQFEINANRILRQLGSAYTGLALMLVDVDDFKSVNDTFGHEAGDDLLKEISRRIREASRQSELIVQSQLETARIGGDEFIIIYHLDDKESDIATLAQRLLYNIIKPMTLVGEAYKPSVSIGISLAPEHSTEMTELISLADAAMYQAKRAGGHRFVIADAAITKKKAG